MTRAARTLSPVANVLSSVRRVRFCRLPAPPAAGDVNAVLRELADRTTGSQWALPRVGDYPSTGFEHGSPRDATTNISSHFVRTKWSDDPRLIAPFG